MNETPFTVQLRKATRANHSFSDSLVNAKLAFTLSNDAVWAEGLLVFYEIFKFLEEAMKRSSKTEPLGQIYVDGMNRTEAFEKDLSHYLGSGWKNHYRPRESVLSYLRHLELLEKTNPTLLVVYVYHLYMGLLTGGQILRKKRAVVSRLFGWAPTTRRVHGTSVVDFDAISVFMLKSSLTEKMNSLAEHFDVDLKGRLIDESRTLYELNNEIIRSVEGASVLFYKKLIKFLVIAFIVILLAVYLKRIF